MAWYWYLTSWLVNFLLVALVIAIIDEKKAYVIERDPLALFFLTVVFPTVLELMSYSAEGKPFFAVIMPGFATLVGL